MPTNETPVAQHNEAPDGKRRRVLKNEEGGTCPSAAVGSDGTAASGAAVAASAEGTSGDCGVPPGSFVDIAVQIRSLDIDISNYESELKRIGKAKHGIEQARQQLVALQADESDRAARVIEFKSSSAKKAWHEILQRIGGPNSVKHGKGLVPLPDFRLLAHAQTSHRASPKGRVFELCAEVTGRSTQEVKDMVKSESIRDPVAGFVSDEHGFQGYLSWMQTLQHERGASPTSRLITLQVLAWTLDVTVVWFRQGKPKARIFHPYGPDERQTPVVALFGFTGRMPTEHVVRLST